MGDADRAGGGDKSYTVGGVVIGLVLAYPISYFFQPGYLRAKLSLGEYIIEIADILDEPKLVSAVVISFIVCPVVLGIVGRLIDRKSKA